MHDAADIEEEDLRGLAELAALDLRLARTFAARAEAAEDPEVANGLARSYQRMARSYRQSLALKARLKREVKREAREDRADARAEAVRRVLVRRDQVRAAVKSLIWSEAEGSEADRLEDELEALLDLDAAAGDFAEVPAGRHVERLRADLGLKAEAPAPEDCRPGGPIRGPGDVSAAPVSRLACPSRQACGVADGEGAGKPHPP